MNSKRTRSGIGRAGIGWSALVAALLGTFIAPAGMAATKPRSGPLPVLLVIADRQDFHYREYADTRRALEGAGVPVEVAATTTEPAWPESGSGEPAASDPSVTPDLRLREVDPAGYSAIAFVGGWGSSAYQYAYNDPNFDGVIDNFYLHAPYNGDDDLEDGRIGEGKAVVNRLIEAFVKAAKPVAAVGHGTTVLAWARVDGVSPLAGRRVSVPFIGAPATYFRGRWYADHELGQFEQVRINGGIPNRFSGQYGNPRTATDDVIVDGRIITGENYEAAIQFGKVLAREVILAAAPARPLRPVGR